jgi:Holliday junction resolvase RusA-like endonuclease
MTPAVLTVVFPVPPSVNRLYLKGRWGNKYRNPTLIAEEGSHIATLRQMMRAYKWKPTVPVSLEITLYWQGTRKRDLDNILKVLLDRISSAIHVDDDMFHDIHLIKVPIDGGGSSVKVRLWGTT